MDSPFLTLVFLSLGLFLSLFAPLVHSQKHGNIGTESSPPAQLPLPPPHPPPSPPPPRSSPLSPSPPPPPHRRTTPRSPPPPRSRPRAKLRTPPPPSKPKLNLGKKIGLIFTGIVVIMQVGVVAFLLVKRHQLLKKQ